MTNDWKVREKFLREIGLFSVQFCQLELGVTELASFTIDDIRYWEVQYQEIFGLNLEHKRELIKKFLQKEIPQLYTEWETINTEIGVLNHNRRHLIHGTGNSYLLHPKIKTQIKNNRKIEMREFSVRDIKELTNRIGHICSGANGILGIFNTKFKTMSIDWYNSNSENHKKIIYKVNNDIQTEWKG